MGLRAGFEFFALPHKVAALVTVHPARTGGAVAVLEGDGALELVMRFVRGRLHTQQRAEFNDKALRSGQLGSGHAVPALDEGLGGFCGGSGDSAVGGGWGFACGE